MLKIKSLNTSSKAFDKDFNKFINKRIFRSEKVQNKVNLILKDILLNGDRALLKYTKKYDNYDAKKIKNLKVSQKEINNSFKIISKEDLSAIKFAAKNIYKFSNLQKIKDWKYSDSIGITFGQKCSPIEKVGIYVPGGSASYPSSVLMNAIPAKVAGVDNIVMVTPATNGEINPAVLVAAKVAGVNSIYKIGGAQAIAALAFGTKIIPKVFKVVGPGNNFVATAKKTLFGQIGIDSFAGPSEIMIVADSTANVDWLTADIFAQSEHDNQAQSILVTNSQELIKKVSKNIEKKIQNMKRKRIIKHSLENYGLMIKTKSISESKKIINLVAPEHLQLSVKNPSKLMNGNLNAGAIFMGPQSPEVFGDYCAGPNHVLPTMGTAKFSSPLGVYDFQKRSNFLKCSSRAVKQLSINSEILANSENLDAHSISARLRRNLKW